MPQDVNRGYFPSDEAEFSDGRLPGLREAQRDIIHLVDRGYDLTRSVTFVSDRFQFSARQRAALTRATSATAAVEARRERRVSGGLNGAAVYIDGFNLIITLEAALSLRTTLLRCMDGTIRDLCGLRGTYRLIEATETALAFIGGALLRRGAGRAVFYLDAPVSNSGRLCGAILWEMERGKLPAEVHLVPSADAALWNKERVVTSDAVILERCGSWLNLAAEILAENLPERRVVDLTGI